MREDDIRRDKWRECEIIQQREERGGDKKNKTKRGCVIRII